MTSEHPEFLGAHPENTESAQRYFEDAGEKLWKKELTVLSKEPFRVAGPEAEKDGWTLGRNGIVQATLVAKLAESLQLSEEETVLLTQAAFFTSVMVRAQKEALAKENPPRTFKESTIAERFAFDAQGAEALKAKGVDARVVEIAMDAHSPEFYEKAWRGEIQPKDAHEEQTLKLKRYLTYVHNSVVRNTDTGATTYVIAPWQERLSLTKEDYKKFGAEQHSMEAALTESIETELCEIVLAKKPRALNDGTPLWQFLRSEILEDVRAGSLPKVPRRGI